jgi:hypothetical protein
VTWRVRPDEPLTLDELLVVGAFDDLEPPAWLKAAAFAKLDDVEQER